MRLASDQNRDTQPVPPPTGRECQSFKRTVTRFVPIAQDRVQVLAEDYHITVDVGQHLDQIACGVVGEDFVGGFVFILDVGDPTTGIIVPVVDLAVVVHAVYVHVATVAEAKEAAVQDVAR